LIIGLGCAVGALLIGIVVVIWILVKKSKEQQARNQLVYGGTAANPSGELSPLMDQ